VQTAVSVVTVQHAITSYRGLKQHSCIHSPVG